MPKGKGADEAKRRLGLRYPASLQFKELGERHGQEIWSARVTLKYRALAAKFPDEYLWFWIGEHNVYDALTR